MKKAEKKRNQKPRLLPAYPALVRYVVLNEDFLCLPTPLIPRLAVCSVLSFLMLSFFPVSSFLFFSTPRLPLPFCLGERQKKFLSAAGNPHVRLSGQPAQPVTGPVTENTRRVPRATQGPGRHKYPDKTGATPKKKNHTHGAREQCRILPSTCSVSVSHVPLPVGDTKTQKLKKGRPARRCTDQGADQEFRE